MSFKRCFKFAGVLAIGGLVTFVKVSAQQPTITDTRFTNQIHAGSNKSRPEPPATLYLPNANQLTLLDKAYLDAMSILREDNTCSAFYGGPPAIEALNQLKEQLEPKHLDSTVGVRMTGETMAVISFRYPLMSYRLFGKAELNLDGPFYRVSVSHLRQSIGGFRPNTREARVTILLHELGHLVKGIDQQWLLPGDGIDEHLSDENTERVIAVCGKQIRSLRQVTFAQQLVTARLTSRSR